VKKISHPHPAPTPAELAAECRRGGLVATAQRVAVLAALRAACDHPSPEALHARLKPRHPGLSLGTVYKALHQFTDAGLAREVSVAGDNARRFDGNLAPHHHLVCEHCRRVIDHCDPTLDRIPLPTRLPRFRARAVTVDVLGTCARCVAERAGGGAATARSRRARPR
jgi:Fur family transcriptional regulator, peroxide stress response regulator